MLFSQSVNQTFQQRECILNSHNFPKILISCYLMEGIEKSLNCDDFLLKKILSLGRQLWDFDRVIIYILNGNSY